MSLRAERFTHTADTCQQLPLPSHACTGRASGGNGEFRTASCLKTTPKLMFLPQDDGWKHYYDRSNDQEHVVDLGPFHDEGELLIAADNRLAELLE